MALKGLLLLNTCRSISIIRPIRRHVSLITVNKEPRNIKHKEYKTEDNFVYLEDPDTFGTLSGRVKSQNSTLDDEGDIKEQQYLEQAPLLTQKLTIKQYADLIKQYLKHKRLKEAIDVLEVRMLTQDRVKPDNYIFNILIGACADVGYTKKAFKLFNEMKRRALKTTGDTYTCLFHACANSPWPSDGLKNALHLRTLMIEKGIDPNLTNYNAMIKAFGRCGDLKTAFQIVDEMISKKMKIRVHTFNHLLHACISDKSTGLKYALVTWRKMLKMRENPNIYSFNLMLKCVKECNLGDNEDIEDLISIIQEQMLFNIKNHNRLLQIESSNPILIEESKLNSRSSVDNKTNLDSHKIQESECQPTNSESSSELIVTKTDIHLPAASSSQLQYVNKLQNSPQKPEDRTVPNFLSKVVKLQHVVSLQGVHNLQDKFAIVGSQDDFLKEMEAYSVKPDIKTFTQMIPLIEDTREAENKLIETMKCLKIKTDIDFYNMLMKKRCLRTDYDGAIEVKEMIKAESEYRKKRYSLRKKYQLKLNIMSYGILAMACKTKEHAEKFLNEMKEQQIKVNIEILGSLLRNGTVHNQFGYIVYIMNIVKEENVKVNDIFIKHLETFVDKCANIVKQDEEGQCKCPEGFLKAYKRFLGVYNNWLKDINVAEALTVEHPWKQFRENYPETVQRQDITIVEPKKFYKRKRKFVPYTPRL